MEEAVMCVVKERTLSLEQQQMLNSEKTGKLAEDETARKVIESVVGRAHDAEQEEDVGLYFLACLETEEKHAARAISGFALGARGALSNPFMHHRGTSCRMALVETTTMSCLGLPGCRSSRRSREGAPR